RKTGLQQILESAMGAEAAGPLLSRHARERAQGALQVAESAFDWSISAAAGKRRIAQAGTSMGFLTTETEFDTPFVATVFGERLLQSGVRMRAGVFLASDLRQDARRALNPLVNRPQLTFDIPVTGALGEPAEALRLEAARNDVVAADFDTRIARAAYLHRVAAGFWKMLAAQRRVQADRSLRDTTAEVASQLGRLAERGEAAAAEAAQWRARTQLREIGLQKATLEVATLRRELLSLLRLEQRPEWQGLDLAAEFPDEGAQPVGLAHAAPLVERALQLRPDYLRLKEQVNAAQLRARAADRESADRLALVAGLDRLMLEWSTVLGGNRNSGLRRQHEQDAEIARLNLQELRRAIGVEIEQHLARLAAAAQAARALRPVTAQMARHVDGVRRQVAAGLSPASALAESAEALAQALKERIEAQAQHAQAIADLRLALAELSDPGIGAATLAEMLRRAPLASR
ncbi:MAG: TolC family protein, partial [Pseudomonadota bacterium]